MLCGQFWDDVEDRYGDIWGWCMIVISTIYQLRDLIIRPQCYKLQLDTMIRAINTLTNYSIKNNKITTICSSSIKNAYLTNKYTYNFSNNNNNIHNIKSILNKITVNVQGQSKNVLDSGLVANYSFQQTQNKVMIVVRTGKDFARLRNFIKMSFNKEGFQNVQIVLQQKENKKVFQRKGNLKQIKNIIAVSSCKGGVGKSTIAVNIAFGLHLQGFKVGIFDSDVYGPSLPTLVNKQGQVLQSSKDNATNIIPIDVDGVKCMSFGFVANQPAAMRGPMASSIISQLLLQTQWGNLDYLIVDTPPGTGDVNLSLCQQLKFDGAVIVTTPQRLSFIDVLKGIKVFQDLRVKILGVVQNMSYYSCSKCNMTDEIFGKGHNKLITDQLGIQNSFKLPLMSQVSKCSDAGIPAVKMLPEGHIVKQTYLNICNLVKKQLEKPRSISGAFYDTGSRMIIVQQGKISKKIDPVTLRSKCVCPKCIDELTGKSLIDISKIDPQVFPSKIEQKGNYAIGVTWSDGHKNSIYSFKRLFSDEIVSK